MEWISVKDELPKTEDFGFCISSENLLISRDNNVECGTLVGDKWYSLLGDVILGVTHWMPLPKPPKTD